MRAAEFILENNNLNYIGNCTDDDVIEHIFGDATGFAQAVEEHGDEFTIDDLVVKYDPATDIHSFYYKNNIVNEIERISKSGYEGGKDAMKFDYGREKTIRPLPGGSGLLYSITDGGGDYEVKIWDPRVKEFNPGEPPKRYSWQTNAEYNRSVENWKQRVKIWKRDFARSPGHLVGKLSLEDAEFPLRGAVQVNTITVDEDYRGRGIAKALYGIVLTIMRRPLVAGSSQTPGGRQNWASLSQIPGVQMKGYVILDEEDLETDPYDSDARWAKKAEQNIDTIMGKLGGQYIGSQPGEYYFAFDVQPASTGRELKAYVDTNLSKVYSNGYRSGSQYGLFAVWTGQ